MEFAREFKADKNATSARYADKLGEISGNVSGSDRYSPGGAPLILLEYTEKNDKYPHYCPVISRITATV
jgi:hypothetical protein